MRACLRRASGKSTACPHPAEPLQRSAVSLIIVTIITTAIITIIILLLLIIVIPLLRLLLCLAPAQDLAPPRGSMSKLQAKGGRDKAVGASESRTFRGLGV